MTTPLMGGKWGSTTLGTASGVISWSFAASRGEYFQFSSAITSGAYQNLVRLAFQAWEAVTNVDFVEVRDSTSSDLRLGWQSIDRAGGIVAEAAWDQPGATVTYGEIRFDPAESWSVSAAVSGFDFYATAVHEIGHILGLGHSEDFDSIMYAYSNPATELSGGDIQAVQTLYGIGGVASPGNFIGGTVKGEWLFGTSARDVINGGGGNDFLLGGGSRDQLYGSDGDDWISGGADDDIMVGGSGNDQLWGLEGADYMVGDEGDDILVFGPASGALGYGGAGTDSLIGSDGAGYMQGDAGNDFIFAYGGADTLVGGADSDSLSAGTGSDFILGGTGSDTFYFNDGGIAGGDFDQVADFEDDVDWIALPAYVQASVTWADTSLGAFLSIPTAAGLWGVFFSGTTVAQISDDVLYV